MLNQFGKPLMGMIVFFFLFTSVTSGDEAEDRVESSDTLEFIPGIVVTYEMSNGDSITRIEQDLGGSLTEDSLARFPDFPEQVRWDGFVFARPEGEFRFYGFVQGTLELEIDGITVFEMKTDQPRWVASTPINLEYGHRRLRMIYDKVDGRSPLKIAWSGPGFQREPIPATALFHHQTKKQVTRSRAADVVHHSRCNACHEFGEGAIETTPSLANLSGYLSKNWLTDWLADPHGHVSNQMPRFDLTREQASDVADYLLSFGSEESALDDLKQKQSPEVQEGRQLFTTVGCLACHHVDGLNKPDPSRRDLSKIAEKRPLAFFETYLKEPHKINPNHAMPVFELTEEERKSLAAYLATLGEDRHHSPTSASSGAVAQGRAWVRHFRCANCHDLPEQGLASKLLKTPGLSDDEASCFRKSDPALGRPFIPLSELDEEIVREALSGKATPDRWTPSFDPLAVLETKKCVACHQRGATGGISDSVMALVESQPELASQVQALVPPSLNQVGDKLNFDALTDAISGQSPVRRDWLQIRMPRYRFKDGEVTALAKALSSRDQFPEDQLFASDHTEGELNHAGARLVTAAGFGCTSCHAIGEVRPPDAPLNARGPDLSQLGKRVRKSWFQRWTRNPARIVPRVEMPAITHPVPDVLGQDLDSQLAAIWHVLDDPDFRPAVSNPLRVVRRSGEVEQPSVVLTDVLYSRGEQFIKPFLVALSNRHNVLYDLQSGRLKQWTIGDAAQQRTEGKTWFWEISGTDVMFATDDESEWTLQVEDKSFSPTLVGQFVTQAERWRHLDGGVELQGSLRFQESNAANIQVTQRFLAISPSSWQRHLTVDVSHSKGSLNLQVIPSILQETVRFSEDQREATLGDWATIKIVEPTDARFQGQGQVVLPDEQTLVLEYISQVVPDRFVMNPSGVTEETVTPVDAVPGFVGRRLPIGNEMMPTGLSWNEEALFVSSLKGRVWRVVDRNDDSVEDLATVFSDELAAPYGLQAFATHVDVVNKYGLLRLFDRDHDRRSDDVVTLASGWGHTADYHDWAVGLPVDDQGRYLIALACQQDDRSEAAAYLRGRLLRVGPEHPNQPLSFKVETISEGHRFPMGLARSRQGVVMATDNQGNYNPYNELNHVVAGAHFGFVNKLESLDDRPPVKAPAIRIPHPWTRSVNGICFLETPAGREDGSFGPFEGHLIGCEYDTRRLVRFSLQQVDGTLQGAAYPFSFQTDDESLGLMGPIVCAVSPRAELYVGEIRDSGWGGGQNVGAIVQLKPDFDQLPHGIAEVRAIKDGFVIEFLRAVDSQRATDAENFSIASVTRQPTPAYGGADKDRRNETIESIRQVDDHTVEIRLGAMRSGYVYEFRLRNLVPEGQLFHPAQAFYTLNVIPGDQTSSDDPNSN